MSMLPSTLISLAVMAFGFLFFASSDGGPLGGDLSGVAQDAQVVGLQGRPIGIAAPANNQCYVWSESNERWQPGDCGAGEGLENGYASVTDGTTTASASGADTFKLRGSDALTVTVTSNDETHGDNALFALTTSPASAATLVGTGRTLTGGTCIGALGDLSADRTVNFDVSCSPALTGAWDYGGATSVELPNGAGGTTVDAAGEVTVDTTTGTLNYHEGTAERAIKPVESKGLFLESPVDGDDFPLIRLDEAITLTKVCYLAVGGTSWTGQLQEFDGNGANPADTQASDTEASAGTTACVTSFSNASFDADDWLGIDTEAVSGEVTRLHVTFWYRVNA